jgi:hypothetical protein
VAVTGKSSTLVRAIQDDDIGVVADFLHRNQSSRVSVERWERAMRPSWDEHQPNHGFLLEDRGVVVGAHLALYATRLVDGQREAFCNLAAWCVLPAHRHQGLRLLRALLAQPGYNFTDFSPSGNVVELNRRLRFEALDTTTALVPNLPLPRISGRGAIRLTSDPDEVRDRLEGRERTLYEDHVGAGAAHHLVLVRGRETCYVVFRRDRRKHLPLFASLLYVGNPALFEAGQRLVYRHLLLRHRIPFTLVELRVARSRPRLAVMLRSPRPKMYRSPTLAADQIDYLYSELACVSW